jgi:uncharacterized protein YpuA (DUF1002 family)
MIAETVGHFRAEYESRTHHPETKANCMMVKVTGRGKAFRIDFEEVLVIAEDMYHIRHNNYQCG